jgi:hypothetical protein
MAKQDRRGLESGNVPGGLPITGRINRPPGGWFVQSTARGQHTGVAKHITEDEQAICGAPERKMSRRVPRGRDNGEVTHSIARLQAACDGMGWPGEARVPGVR